MRFAYFLIVALAGQAAAQHPRIFLDANTLASLRKSTVGNPEWTALKAQCDAYLPGVVYPGKSEQGRYDYFAVGGDYTKANARNPNIGVGYQGGSTSVGFNAYWDSIMNLGVCYHTILPSDAGQAAKYAAKVVDILNIVATPPGEALVLSGKRSGQKRYIYDSTFVRGTAWAGARMVVDGSFAVGATTIAVRGGVPNQTIRAGDGFAINGQIYLARADVTLNGTGKASVPLGSQSAVGSVNTHDRLPVAVVDGTAITNPLVVESYQHNLATGDQVQISGVLGNTNANGTWTITAVDNFRFILNGAPAGNALQTNLAQDALLNNGYGARFYGVAISIGYDWFYDVISPALRSQLQTASVRWIREAERNGYGQAHPAGNYYAGQFIAKLFAALALEGDDPDGDALWTSWYTNEWTATARTYTVADSPVACSSGNCPGVQQYFDTYLVDTAHPDGANYGWLATMNYLWAVMAVQSAKGMDLTTAPAPGFNWGLSAAKAIIHQTWPNRTTFNTRQKLFNGDDPARVFGDALYTISGYLRKHHPSFAPYFQSYANDTVAGLNNVPAYSAKAPFAGLEWNAFLFWNPNAPATDYKTLPLSFYSAGSGEMEMRSDWTTSAVWASLIAGPNVHSVEGGKDSKDRGALAISRGDTGFLVNASYELYKAGQVAYADNLTLGEGVAEITNTFQVNSGERWRQGYYGPGATTDCMKPNRSMVASSSQQSTYVYAQALNLADNYYPIGYYTAYPGQSSACGGVKPVSSWTRQVFYLRPSLFLVYDQTQIASPLNDQFIAWHFTNGVSLASSTTEALRYDVRNSTEFLGAMISLLPAKRDVSIIDQGGFGVVDRVEIRPPSPAAGSQVWLTAFDAALSSGEVHALALIRGQNVDGVEIPQNNTVVVFVRVGAASGAQLSYNLRTGSSQHHVVGVVPNAAYLANGQPVTSDAAGILTFQTGGASSVVITLPPLASMPRLPAQGVRLMDGSRGSLQ